MQFWTMATMLAGLAAAALSMGLQTEQANAANTCGFGWARPGKYTVSGNFRGKVESTSARLTTDCRVSLQIPGVFTGGKVKPSGGCLRFSMKIEGERKTLVAKWCNTYGLVPWNGRTIRASIKRVSVEQERPKTKSNFNN